ncbi:DUF6949 family protein [Afifella pfennigii]|uniref:DUF6949 family protein n=1 Tax=Afifella pfennigii TaxID=209897 RepID=UPI0012EC774F|nr:hypothetical protein [Afifella pfennigii]
MSELQVLVFCAVTGFVAAATVASFYQWVTSQPADFRITAYSWSALSVTALLCVAAGPFIVAQRVRAALASEGTKLVPVLFGLAVCGLWSVCAGTLFLSLLIVVSA